MLDSVHVNSADLLVTIVNACQRDGRGGSPTAVLDEVALSDDERRRVPLAMGTSHAVFVCVDDGAVSLRFFTAEGELPACGHGTVAALAYLAERDGRSEYQLALRTSARSFAGRAVRLKNQFQAAFDPGSVELREPASSEQELVVRALGITSNALASGTCVASVGRPRMLVPVSTRSDLATLSPDFDQLRDACDRHGLLGCYVYSTPTPDGRAAARMFAPSIGVPEDIANANSTACLAARLARDGMTDITVDMGDTLGSPSTISATASLNQAGPVIQVGGAATIERVVRL